MMSLELESRLPSLRTAADHVVRVRETRVICVTLLLLFSLAATAAAQRNVKNIPPPDPELERKSFKLPAGFEANLFAADPKIAKPIQINFDPAGRLWIASSEVYPHIKPGQKANDKILVLEDTNGDGRSDKTTVFADGLLIPTGVLPGDGGAYVANSTEMLHLRDTNGDGKADRERVVLSGFGTEDTHHIIHTLRWGPEGYLYFNQSIYIHSHIETPYGVRRLGGSGMWWFRPETMRLEVFARGLVNPWGNAWTARGATLSTDGAGGEGINYIIPGAYYRTAVGAKRIVPGLNPGSPKYCGLEIVDGRHLPDDWQGDLITHDFRGHRVCRFKLEESGSGFISRQMPDLITSKHVAFRPIDVKMGPDGAIYIADWYNPIIQHGEVDFRDPRRDHTHGRIWRITYKGRKLVPRPKLVDATVPQLLEQLKAPESWARRQTRRVLKERGREKVLPELRKWVAGLGDEDQHRLEALWVFHALGEAERSLLERCLASKDHGVRAAGVRILAFWIDEGFARDADKTMALLRERVADEHPRVRLEAVRAISRWPDPAAIELAMRALDREVDNSLDYALWLTAWESRDRWLPLLRSGKLTFGGNVDHLTFALRAAESPSAVPTLLALLKKGDLDATRAANVVQLLAVLGGPGELRQVLDLVLAEGTPANQRRTLLKTLVTTSQTRAVRPGGDLNRLGKLFDAKDAATAQLAMTLAGRWKVGSLAEPLVGIVRNDKATQRTRLAAMRSLAILGGAKSTETLQAIAQSKATTPLRLEAAAGLVSIDSQKAAGVAAELLSDFKQGDPTVLFNAFLGRKNAAKQLAAALKGKRISADAAKLGLRAVSAAGRAEPELQKALQEAGQIETGPRKLSKKEMDAMVAGVAKQGDPHRGELIFRRTGLACMKCHAIGGAGGKVGPDLVSLGGSAQVDYLIESLLDPNAKVKENYHTLLVTTTKGKILSGVPVRKTNSQLLLRDAEDREIAIPLADIDEQKNGASIMPTGLVQSLTQAEMLDLVRFLSELGKEGPFRVGKQPVVRRWRVMSATPEAAFGLRRTSYATATTDDPAFTWQPAYSTVAGVLPLTDLPELRVRNRVAKGSKGVAFARAEIDVSTAGDFTLALNSPQALQLWVDDKPVTPAAQMPVSLTKGRHRLTFAIDLSERETGLRVELMTAAKVSARAEFVSGK